MALGLTVSKIDRGQRSVWSGRSKIDCNSLCRIIYTIYIYTVQLECTLTGLPWQRFDVSKCI